MSGRGRLSNYKNYGKNCDELRRRRRAKSLSKHRNGFKFNNLVKRRNIDWQQLESPPQLVSFAMHPPVPDGSPPPVKFNQNVFNKIIDDLFSDNGEKNLRGARLARNVLSQEDHPPFEVFIQAAVVQRCVLFLQYKLNPELQCECGWILANISSGNLEQAHFVGSHGAVKPLIAMLRSPNYPVVSLAATALANITGGNIVTRDAVIRQGAVFPLVALVQRTNFMDLDEVPLLRAVALTLSNLCIGRNPSGSTEDAIHQSIGGLVLLIQHEDVEVVFHSCRAISHICGSSVSLKEETIEVGIVPRLVQLLTSSNDFVVLSCLTSIANIVSRSESQTDAVVNAGVLPHLTNLLVSSANPAVRKDAVWVISNIITGGKSKHIHMIMKTNIIIPSFMALLQLDNVDVAIQHHAIWALRNITCQDLLSRHFLYLIQQGIIPTLCSFLLRFPSSETTVMLILETLENLLVGAYDMDQVHKITSMIEECGGLDMMKRLQISSTGDVQRKASTINKNFFSCCSDSESDTSSSY